MRRSLILAGLSLALLSQPAMAADDLSDRRALAHELVELSGGAANTKATTTQMTQGIMTGLRQAAPNAPESILKAMQASTNEAVDELMPDIIALSESVYAETFSRQELVDIIAFYKTPAGQALIAKMPTLGGTIGSRMPALQTKMQLAVLTRFCAKVACPQATRDQMQSLRAMVRRTNPS